MNFKMTLYVHPFQYEGRKHLSTMIMVWENDYTVVSSHARSTYVEETSSLLDASMDLFMIYRGVKDLLLRLGHTVETDISMSDIRSVLEENLK